jgi:hypothetical protein
MPAPLRALLVVTGVLAVLVGALMDFEALGDFVIPLWAYLAAHLAILASFLKRGAFKNLAFALPVFALTIPMTCLGMSSLGHYLYRIKPGMDVAQVRRIMVGFKEGSGLISPYTGEEFIPAGCLIFRDPRHSESHRAWGTVNIHDGRVTDVFIAPD